MQYNATHAYVYTSHTINNNIAVLPFQRHFWLMAEILQFLFRQWVYLRIIFALAYTYYMGNN